MNNLNKNLLCLKWDDFDNFVVNGLSSLYQKDDMSDVSLFCSGRSFKAHKVVLSIWSPYFREIFATTSQQNPVIVLRETTSADLEMILRFIYQGQLFVPFEDTDRFLKTAEYFQIAGLRDMRVHLSTTTTTTTLTNERGTKQGTAPSSVSGPGYNSPSEQMQHNSSSVNLGIISGTNGIQFSSSSVPSYAIHGVTTSSVDGIPVQIINSAPPSSTHQQQHSQQNEGVMNPISIITNNNNPQSGGGPTQFATNVIKPIPNRQSTNNNNSNSSSNRIHQPILASPTSSGFVPTNYGQSLPPNPSLHRQQQQGRPSEMVYNGQPILIVQQQKQTEYHHNDINNRGMSDSTRSSEVLLLEQVEHNASTYSSAIDKKRGENNDTTGYSHVPEEVLGLTYLHDSSRSSSSHIIQEAAVAAGVEDTEIMDRDSFMSDSNGISNIKSSTKMNSVVLTPPSNTPVYAVKRIPSHSSDTTKTSDTISPRTTSTASTSSSSSKSFKPKNKRQRKTSSSHTAADTDVELVGCHICDKRVKKTSLKVHIKRCHLDEGTVLICPVCSKQCSSKGVYYKHMYGHRQKAAGVASKPRGNSKQNITAKLKNEID